MAAQQQQMILQQQQLTAQQQRQLEVQQQQQQVDLQKEQTTLLKDGLLTAHQTATAAIDRAVAPRVQRAGNITDFKRLNPKEFSGTERPLVAEQWLLDTTNLMQGANILEAE